MNQKCKLCQCSASILINQACKRCCQYPATLNLIDAAINWYRVRYSSEADQIEAESKLAKAVEQL